VLGLGAGLLCVGLLLPWGVHLWQVRRQEKPAGGELRPELVELPAGTFQMGSPKTDPEHDYDERLHEVELRPFAIARTEVTQLQYAQVLGERPSRFKDEKGDESLPVERVTWHDAIRYCNRLTELERQRGVAGLVPCYEGEGDQVKWKPGCTGYRLPTEAEWEYAARAMQGTRYAGGDELDKVAWDGKNSGDKTHPVKGKEANAWGLYDMSGNVDEWVWDWYDENYSAEKKDPRGPDSGSRRVGRGGSIWNSPQALRVANRYGVSPGDNLGLRVARSLP
jgi:formylglycine-generating enzyme required for sulfatase activity